MKKHSLTLAHELLSGDDETSVEDMLEAIVEANKTDPRGLIDYVDGVSTWEKIELEFTCEDFLKHIEVEYNHFIEDMKLSRDAECFNIYIDEGEDKEPIHICYWHCDEWEENPKEVVPAMTRAMEMFYTDKEGLLELLGYEHYALGFYSPFEDWTTLEMFEYLKDMYCIKEDEDYDNWMHSRSDMLNMCEDYNN